MYFSNIKDSKKKQTNKEHENTKKWITINDT